MGKLSLRADSRISTSYYYRLAAKKKHSRTAGPRAVQGRPRSLHDVFMGQGRLLGCIYGLWMSRAYLIFSNRTPQKSNLFWGIFLGAKTPQKNEENSPKNRSREGYGGGLLKSISPMYPLRGWLHLLSRYATRPAPPSGSVLVAKIPFDT